jgi:EAL domain-containing protein (putative c-di-GMP-specific phosphodiesterase class I)
MYRAKRDGKNRYALFESGMQLDAHSNLELEMDLHVAVQEEQFCLVYQPIFDLRDSRPKGMEALLRWNHPTRGVVSPLDFIPTLEKSNLICVVGKWVIDEACRQAAEWQTQGASTSISVNVSGKQLESDELLGHVSEALAETQLDPGALTIEVTETALMRDPDAAARRLSAIAELGVRIAIDDFGTGYSSLAHLQKFPIDLLKIDQSFVTQMAGNPEGATLIETLVQLGKSLSIETLAEGIEETGQLQQLIEHDCDSGQGFLFARPLDAEAATDFLRSTVAQRS